MYQARRSCPRRASPPRAANTRPQRRSLRFAPVSVTTPMIPAPRLAPTSTTRAPDRLSNRPGDLGNDRVRVAPGGAESAGLSWASRLVLRGRRIDAHTQRRAGPGPHRPAAPAPHRLDGRAFASVQPPTLPHPGARRHGGMSFASPPSRAGPSRVRPPRVPGRHAQRGGGTTRYREADPTSPTSETGDNVVSPSPSVRRYGRVRHAGRCARTDIAGNFLIGNAIVSPFSHLYWKYPLQRCILGRNSITCERSDRQYPWDSIDGTR